MRLAQSFCVALALTLFASPALAQFTAVVQPPKSRAEPAAATAVPGATTDSTGATALSDMRAWVDSAAGVRAPQVAVADSAAMVTDDSVTLTVSPGEVAPTAQVPEVQDGAMRAPDTATNLPTVAILGITLLAVGTWVLRRTSRVSV